MAEPRFLIQIVEADTGAVVTLPGGGRLERELIAACTQAIVAQRVGVFRTEAHVRQAITDGITQTIRELKRETVAVA